jgi:hypothetical protein
MRLLILVVASVFSLSLARGQALIEYSLAAAGGSAAGVAGKSISDGVDKIFRLLDEKQREAAGEKPAKDVRGRKKEDPWYANMYSTPATNSRLRAKPGVQRPVNPVMSLPRFSFDPANVYLMPAPNPRPPTRPAVTPAQIAQVTPGALREDVLSSLGRPSSRVTIPEGSTLVEIYQYASRRTVVGTLRLKDGVVSSVRVVEP